AGAPHEGPRDRTWGAIVLELSLVLTLTMGQANPLRRPLLAAAVVFHASNVLLFGLSSFFLCMTGAAFLLVWPYRRELPLPHSLVEGMSEARVCRAAICRWVLALRSPSGLFELRNYKLEGRRFL